MLNVKRAAFAAAILLIAACSGDAGKLLGPSESPAPDISDAAHAGAVPGFYFLPPMVSAPSFSGSFDPALSPRVEICALSGSACGATIATYTTTSGAGSEVVRVSTTDQHYAVNWHTNLFNLDPTKTYRISVYAGTMLLGFADVDVVNSGRELKNVDTQQYIPLVDDRTLPIKFRIETGIVGQVVVAPAADTVNVGGTAQFAATLLDLHGNPVSGPTVAWSSSNAAVAAVDAGGVATGVAPGTVTITASLGYVSGTASLTVEQPNQPPTSADDSFEAIGNVTVPVPAPGVLANDTDPDGNTLTATAGTFPTANGGAVVLNADGSFTYLSAPGFTGSDSFTYTATDGIATSTSTVTVAVPTRVWYVSNAGSAPGDGRDTSPFVRLKAAESASAAGETIFLLTGNGSASGYDEGIVLKNGQSLTGQGISSNVMATLNGHPVILLAAGSAPTVTRADAGATIQLASNNTVQGVHVASSNGAGIVGSGFGIFTAGMLSVSAQGGPALDLANGTVAASLGNVSSTSSTGAGLELSGLSGTLSATGGSVSGAMGVGVSVSGGTADITYAGDISGSGARAVSVTGRTGGTVTLSGSISDASGGFLVQNNTGGTIAFTGPAKALSTSTSAAVTLAGNTGSSIVFAGGGLSIATTTGTGFLATGGGTVTVTGANNAIGTTAGTALRVENTTIGASGLTFRSISASNGANGIVLANTGAVNGLQVTGTGSAGTGGTIQNTTGSGIQATSAANLSLSWMNLTNANTVDGGTSATTCRNDDVSTCNAAVDLDGVTGVTLT
ncbi:MAG TPA: Ig-like domain-containing protein, partial [Longimicrobiaceae bacterium]|nr:Ig-like domain-containing protein [Longimicrobiaceae bacterium]